MMYLQISESVNALLKRSRRRRTIGIKVHQGQVQVSAPYDAPLSEIQQFVEQKARWISRHLDRQLSLQALHQQSQYRQGETLWVMGQRCELTLIEGASTGLADDLFVLPASLSSHQERALAVANWFIDLAVEYLPQRVEHWSSLMGLQAGRIKIRHYKTRWGSCDRRGGLQFNWLIMMAPKVVIDYVVIHELAHLVHFNHSARFWQLVASLMPDYQNHRAWLKKQTHLVWHID